MSDFQRSPLGMFVRSTHGFRNKPPGGAFLVGGRASTQVFGMMDMYRPDSWTRKSPKPRTDIQGAVFGNSYVGGGNVNFTIVDHHYGYSPSGDSWSTLPSDLLRRNRMPGFVREGGGYVSGGETRFPQGQTAGQDTTTVTRFSDGAWSTVSPLPSNRFRHGAVALGGFGRVVGGARVTGFTNAVLNLHDKFDGASWTGDTAYPIADIHITPAVVNQKMHGIASGGQHHKFDPETSTWTTEAQNPSSVGAGAAFTITGKELFYGPSGPNSSANRNVSKWADGAWSTAAPILDPARLDPIAMRSAA